MGGVLRFWLVGQLIRIVLMAACVWLALYLLGIPGAFLLGAQAGASNFVPYLGPIVAAIPVGLVAMPLGFSKLMWAVGIYTVIQSIEGYVIGPLIQRQAAELSPGWTLVAIVLFGIPVRRAGNCSCGASVCRRPRRRSPALCRGLAG